MSDWSYSGDPGSSALDEVRFLLGDTNQTIYSLTDQEVGWLLAQQDPPNTYRSASEAALQMATHYNMLAATTRKIGDLELQADYTALGLKYEKLSMRLMRGRTAYAVGAPFMIDAPFQFDIGLMDDTQSQSGTGPYPKIGYY